MVQTSNLGSAEARGWGANDDLTNGAWLDKYCPGNNRTSDEDSWPWHPILHNCHISPHREVNIEYKPASQGSGVRSLPQGQALVLYDRPGRFKRHEDGMLLARRVFVLSYDGLKLAGTFEILPSGRWQKFGGSLDDLADLICSWVWPNRQNGPSA